MKSQLQKLLLPELWKRKLAHKVILDAGQQVWRDAHYSSPPLSAQYWLIGRQRGKTFAALYIAIETCLNTTGAIVRYCAKTKESALAIVLPTWEILIETLPEALRPSRGKDAHEYKFPNGSRFIVFGTDAQSFAKGRGPRSNLIILDEVGFYQDLENVEAALLPSLQTVNGRVLYVSTPADTLAHPSNARVEAARIASALHHDTFYNNPRVDHDNLIIMEAKRLGQTVEQFKASTYFRREYLAELIQEETSAGMPDFTANRSKIVVDYPIPKYYDGYVSIDLGITSDPHFALFGIHDWAKNILYVTDEIEAVSGTTTIKNFAQIVKDKEKELWGTDYWNGTLIGAKDWAQEFGGWPDYIQEAIQDKAPRQPYMRVGDPAHGFLKDLTTEYLLAVMPSDKIEKRINVDITNNWLANQKIQIHPRCKKLIEQLGGVAWDAKRQKWQHGIYVTGGVHHFDGVDCLVYMARNVQWKREYQLPAPAQLQEAIIGLPDYAVPDRYKVKQDYKSVFGGGLFKRDR